MNGQGYWLQPSLEQQVEPSLEQQEPDLQVEAQLI